jgi:hypothetical protein
VEENKSVNFFCRGDGNPLPAVRWLINGRAISSSRWKTLNHIQTQSRRFTVTPPTSHRVSLTGGSVSLRIEPVIMADDAATISCTADNGAGQPVIANATLKVYREGECR